jgi:N-carbamoyl-L-amino-acid hydrolase
MRDVFARWCREAGCAVTVDRMGNMFARRPGTDDSLPPVVIGSHLDTQIAGGRYDGILGVLAGLEVVRTLNDAGVRTQRPIEIVNWTNEEGARFQPPMLGSAVFAGVRTLEWAHARTDDAGRTVGEELHRIGYAGSATVGGRPLDAYFELHIEQGPLLDDKGIPVGVVAGTYEVRGMNVEVRGETAHSGPTPMASRRNALVGAAMLIVAANDVGWSYAPEGKATTSRIEVWPNLAGILPDYAKVTVDVRHPDSATVDRMVLDVKGAMTDCAQRAQVEIQIVETWQFGSERFDPELVELIRRTARTLGAPSLDLPSQAGHDAYYVSRVAPTAMIFTPCDRGISHNENESTRLEDALPGVNVLLHAVLERADR